MTERRTKKDWACFIEGIALSYKKSKKITLVMDNLNTHTPGSFYEIFPPDKAKAFGTVFEAGTPIGKANLTQVTLGFQFGGQAYSQVIFFETEADLERFRQNKLIFAAEASAVAIKSGAGASLNYSDGVAVFTKSKAGFMYEAALGGQKLKFKPYEVVN